MKRVSVCLQWVFLCGLVAGLASCAQLPTDAMMGLVTLTPQASEARELEPTRTLPPSPLPSASPSPSETPSPRPSATPEPFPTATETLLPSLELPTQPAIEPLRRAWVGVSTYPADSEPGLMFRLDYDPALWAETMGNYGEFVLAHRNIAYCVVTPWTGRGLQSGFRSEHEFRQIGSYYFDVSLVSQEGRERFATYVGGSPRLLTGFQVVFEEEKEDCLADFEKILLTFRIVFATPTPTP